MISTDHRTPNFDVCLVKRPVFLTKARERVNIMVILIMCNEKKNTDLLSQVVFLHCSVALYLFRNIFCITNRLKKVILILKVIF